MNEKQKIFNYLQELSLGETMKAPLRSACETVQRQKDWALATKIYRAQKNNKKYKILKEMDRQEW